MVTPEYKRRLRVLRAILEAATEATQDNEDLTRHQFVVLVCEYGSRAHLTVNEVEGVLCQSVQCMVLPNKEWS